MKHHSVISGPSIVPQAHGEGPREVPRGLTTCHFLLWISLTLVTVTHCGLPLDGQSLKLLCPQCLRLQEVWGWGAKGGPGRGGGEQLILSSLGQLQGALKTGRRGRRRFHSVLLRLGDPGALRRAVGLAKVPGGHLLPP